MTRNTKLVRNKLNKLIATSLCVLTTVSSFTPAFAANDATYNNGTNTVTVPDGTRFLTVDLDTTLDAKALGAAVLEGITYQLFDGSDTLVDTQTADEDGKMTFVSKSGLTTDYYIKESTETTTGFNVDAAKHQVKQTMLDSAQDADGNLTGFTINTGSNIKVADMGKITRDDVIKNTVDIQVGYKASDLDAVYKPKDITVDVYKKADFESGNTMLPDSQGKLTVPNTVTSGKTDQNGIYSVELPYGEYTLRISSYTYNEETVGTAICKVKIDEQGTADNKISLDATTISADQAYVQVVKKDADTGEILALPNTTFQILDSSKNPIEIMGEKEFKTNEAGMFTTTLRLPYGDYYLKEVAAPAGYNIASLVAFTISPETLQSSAALLPEGVTNTMYVVLNDEAQTGTLTVNVKTEKLSSVSRNEDTGLYELEYEVAGVKDVKYALVAIQDVKSVDGTDTVIYAKGAVAAKQASDEDGKVVFEDIPLGSYFLISADAVTDKGFKAAEIDEMLKDKTKLSAFTSTEAKKLVEFLGAETDSELTAAIKTNLTKVELVYDATSANQTEKTQDIVLSSDKVKARNTANIKFAVELKDGKDTDYEKTIFGLYAAEKIEAADGTSIPVDGLIEKMSVSDEGLVELKANIPSGKYYIQQISASDNYKLDETKYEFEFDSDVVTDFKIDADENKIVFEKITAESSKAETAETAETAPTTGDTAPIAGLTAVMLASLAALFVSMKKKSFLK